MPKITELYCFAVDDKDEDDEGVPAIDTELGLMPLMGADLERITSLLPKVQDVANQIGKPLRIYHFTNKRQVGEVMPQPGKPEIPPGRCWNCKALLCGAETNHGKDCTVKKMIDDVLRRAREGRR